MTCINQGSHPYSVHACQLGDRAKQLLSRANNCVAHCYPPDSWCMTSNDTTTVCPFSRIALNAIFGNRLHALSIINFFVNVKGLTTLFFAFPQPGHGEYKLEQDEL